MGPAEMNVSQMQWQPKLLKLTLIANPDCLEGKPTPCYVNPQLISQIMCVCGAVNRRFSQDRPPQEQWHPFIDCTLVRCYGLPDLLVLEPAEAVALQRDRAMGHSPVGAITPNREE